MRHCAWHKCGRAFEPATPGQHFCGKECRIARGVWKAARGGPLVDMLMNGDTDALAAAKLKLEQEIEDAKP